jgi:hypothetical protein
MVYFPVRASHILERGETLLCQLPETPCMKIFHQLEITIQQAYSSFVTGFERICLFWFGAKHHQRSSHRWRRLLPLSNGLCDTCETVPQRVPAQPVHQAGDPICSGCCFEISSLQCLKHLFFVRSSSQHFIVSFCYNRFNFGQQNLLGIFI